jgi:hypothetical protein
MMVCDVVVEAWRFTDGSSASQTIRIVVGFGSFRNCNPVFLWSYFEDHDKAKSDLREFLTKRNPCCIKSEIAKAKFFVPVFVFYSAFW